MEEKADPSRSFGMTGGERCRLVVGSSGEAMNWNLPGVWAKTRPGRSKLRHYKINKEEKGGPSTPFRTSKPPQSKEVGGDGHGMPCPY